MITKIFKILFADIKCKFINTDCSNTRIIVSKDKVSNGKKIKVYRLIKEANLKQIMSAGETAFLTSNSGADIFELNGAKLNIAYKISVDLIARLNLSFNSFEEIVKAADKAKYTNNNFALIKLNSTLCFESDIKDLFTIVSFAPDESGTRMALILLIFKHLNQNI